MKVKAPQITNAFNVPRSSFKASRSWISKFMKRKRFSSRRRTSLCQKLPEAYEEKLLAFQTFVIKLWHSHSCPTGMIGNADQMAVFSNMPANYTAEVRSMKPVRILSSENQKTRVTALQCCLDNRHQLKLYRIFKRKTMPAGLTFLKDAAVGMHPKGWIDVGLMIDTVWNSRPKADLGVHAMLSLDSLRCSVNDRVHEKLAACHADRVIRRRRPSVVS